MERKKIATVLIIEDEQDIRLLLALHFKRKGLQVLEAGSLQEARQISAKLSTNTLITLDLNLPDGNGFTLLEELRSSPVDVPVIVCSAYSDLKREALRKGASAFIQKPILLQILDEKLDELMNR